MQHIEDSEQMTLFRWAVFQSGIYPELDLLFHIPNGGKRGKSEAARFKAMGVKAGVPDLLLPVPRGGFHGLFIELKAPNGVKSSNQDKWLKALSAQGYSVHLCYGWEEASAVILDYLNGNLNLNSSAISTTIPNY